MPLSWESRVRPQNHMAVLSQQLYDSSTPWHQKYCNINNDISSIKQLIKSASYKVCYISSIRTNYSSQCHEVSYIGSSTKTQKHTNDSMYPQSVLKLVIWIVYKSVSNQLWISDTVTCPGGTKQMNGLISSGWYDKQASLTHWCTLPCHLKRGKLFEPKS